MAVNVQLMWKIHILFINNNPILESILDWYLRKMEKNAKNMGLGLRVTLEGKTALTMTAVTDDANKYSIFLKNFTNKFKIPNWYSLVKKINNALLEVSSQIVHSEMAKSCRWRKANGINFESPWEDIWNGSQTYSAIYNVHWHSDIMFTVCPPYMELFKVKVLLLFIRLQFLQRFFFLCVYLKNWTMRSHQIQKKTSVE